jgi:hypothetical protein
MDPTSIPYAQIALNLVGLVTAFMIGALLLVSASRALSRHQPQI